MGHETRPAGHARRCGSRGGAANAPDRRTDGRPLSWNVVSSSAERIEQAKQDWRDQRFPKVPEETEFIALPDPYDTPLR